MKELVIISGKGGTGKTSISAALAALSKNAVMCDCDVDAADMHLLLNPDIKHEEDFYSGNEAIIRTADCLGCGLCTTLCRFGAIKKDVDKNGKRVFTVDPAACEGCGVCAHFCPEQAIDFPSRLCGKWMCSDTRFGPLVHAKLGAAAENSGKLVSMVRKQAKETAEEQNRKLIITDGPPGIGCPVIASLSGASLVLIVTEPTVSGKHDMERVLKLTQHFKIPSAVCVNKWDINPDTTELIEASARKAKARISGRIRYDREVTGAQVKGLTVIEHDAPSAQDIKTIWNNLKLEE